MYFYYDELINMRKIDVENQNEFNVHLFKKHPLIRILNTENKELKYLYLFAADTRIDVTKRPDFKRFHNNN